MKAFACKPLKLSSNKVLVLGSIKGAKEPILCQSPHHNADHGEVNQRLGCFGQDLIVSDQSPTAHQPTERTFYHPAFLSNTKPLVCCGRRTTCTIQRHSFHHPPHEWLPVKASINPNRMQTRHAFTHLLDWLEDQFAALSFWHICCRNQHSQD